MSSPPEAFPAQSTPEGSECGTGIRAGTGDGDSNQDACVLEHLEWKLRSGGVEYTCSFGKQGQVVMKAPDGRVYSAAPQPIGTPSQQPTKAEEKLVDLQQQIDTLTAQVNLLTAQYGMLSTRNLTPESACSDHLSPHIARLANEIDRLATINSTATYHPGWVGPIPRSKIDNLTAAKKQDLDSAIARVYRSEFKGLSGDWEYVSRLAEACLLALHDGGLSFEKEWDSASWQRFQDKSLTLPARIRSLFYWSQCCGSGKHGAWANAGRVIETFYYVGVYRGIIPDV
ncbi:hypothetical protein BDZ91DRAFT_749911 [Kalaharituber pfeilii]|nr:hypothetical protein BDZ91DRAFT_749911 [Kalaharituber pfeilii]